MFSVANMILTLEFTAKGILTVLHSKQGEILNQVQWSINDMSAVTVEALCE